MPFETLDHVAAVSLCRRLQGDQHAFAAIDEANLSSVVHDHLSWAQTEMRTLLAQHEATSSVTPPYDQAEAKQAMAFVQWLINQHLVAQGYLQTLASDAVKAQAMTVDAGTP